VAKNERCRHRQKKAEKQKSRKAEKATEIGSFSTKKRRNTTK
jgi:hypothetical protein